jgi:hypothetical protein
MVLLDDEAVVDAHFSLFGDSANLDARLVHGLRRTYYRLRNHFGRTQRNSLVTYVMWNLASVCLETVLVLVQHRCKVCTKRAIVSKIILDTLDGSARSGVSSGSLFRSIGR